MSKQKTKKSKEQNLTNPAGVITVGLDIGYGVVKVVTDHNSFGFPSVMGHAREIKFQQDMIQQKYPGDQITDDDGEWFVGDLALAQIPDCQRRAFELFHENSLSYAEIADALDCPIGPAKTWVHRARREIVLRLKKRGAICESARRLQSV